MPVNFDMRTTYHLMCDGKKCTNGFKIPFPQCIDREAVIEAAVGEGWKVPKGLDPLVFCPDCHTPEETEERPDDGDHGDCSGAEGEVAPEDAVETEAEADGEAYGEVEGKDDTDNSKKFKVVCFEPGAEPEFFDTRPQAEARVKEIASRLLEEGKGAVGMAIEDPELDGEEAAS